MAASDEARQLLRAARKDWKALGGMHDAEAFAEEIFGFHAHQAAEKALKAWLSLLGVEFPRTHDLSLLLGVLESHGRRVEALQDLIEFNPFAVQCRYDAFEEMGIPLDRASVTERIGDLLRQIENLVDLQENKTA
jgi:HEPN domain-containing protein